MFAETEMSLIIRWHPGNDGDMIVVNVALTFAILQIHMAGQIVQQTEWLDRAEEVIDFRLPLPQQVKHYLEKPDSIDLEVNLQIQGTEFSRRVWLELAKIPFGQTITYKQLAERVGSGARAVANACRKNPFPGIIPCHRVVSVNGIGGFMGYSKGPFVELKRKLLQFESNEAQKICNKITLS